MNSNRPINVSDSGIALITLHNIKINDMEYNKNEEYAFIVR